MTTNLIRRIDEAVLMTDRGEYLQALTAFLEIYGTEDSPPLNSAKAAAGLSYFGLCLALVQKKYKAAADLCKRAMDLEFYNGDHYANPSISPLARHFRWGLSIGIASIGLGSVGRTEMGGYAPKTGILGALQTAPPVVWSGQRLQRVKRKR